MRYQKLDSSRISSEFSDGITQLSKDAHLNVCDEDSATCSMRVKTGWRALFAFSNGWHTIVLIGMIIMTTISSLILPVTALLFGDIFQDFSRFSDEEEDVAKLMDSVKWKTMILSFVGVASFISNTLFYGAWQFYGELQVRNARERVFCSLSHKHLSWYQDRENHTSGLGSRIQT